VAAIGVEALATMHEALEAIATYDDEIDPDEAAKIRTVFDNLATNEDLTDLGSPLSGTEIMAALSIEPGPEVGRAERFLREWRLDTGPLTSTEAKALLKTDFR